MRLNIKWSRLKKTIESYFADSLKKRIRINLTHYGAAHEPESRFWMTLDGDEIYSISKMKWLNDWSKVRGEYSNNKGIENEYDYAKKVMHDNGDYYIDDIQDSLELYLNLSIEKAVNSSDVIIKALSMIDKRLGRRRLTC